MRKSQILTMPAVFALESDGRPGHFAEAAQNAIELESKAIVGDGPELGGISKDRHEKLMRGPHQS